MKRRKTIFFLLSILAIVLVITAFHFLIGRSKTTDLKNPLKETITTDKKGQKLQLKPYHAVKNDKLGGN